MSIFLFSIEKLLNNSDIFNEINKQNFFKCQMFRMLWCPIRQKKMNTHNMHCAWNMKRSSMDFQRIHAQKLCTLMQPLMSKPRKKRGKITKFMKHDAWKHAACLFHYLA